jgi:hypothetical protein
MRKGNKGRRERDVGKRQRDEVKGEIRVGGGVGGG